VLASCREWEQSREEPAAGTSVHRLLCEAVNTGLGDRPTNVGLITVEDAQQFVSRALRTRPSIAT